MGNGLLVYIMAIKDARKSNEANRVISMGKQQTDCLTLGQIDELPQTQKKRYVDTSIEPTSRCPFARETGNPLKNGKSSV